MNGTENTPLLPANGHRTSTARRVVHGALFVVFILMLALVLFVVEGIQHGRHADRSDNGWPWPVDGLPKNPYEAALKILDTAPVIDGHIDLPWLVRLRFANNGSAVDLDQPTVGHLDIPRLREGKVGGFFWSVYIPCPADSDKQQNEEFVPPTWAVRDTLEQIDIAHQLINKYPDTFSLSLTSEDVKKSISEGKVASLLGAEGAHQLGNSIGALRQYYSLGVRYLTLTHMCHNAFADSGGFLTPKKPLHGGLSPLGHKLVYEMNRLGMLVDLSHTSDDTALQALNISRAPVIWSHSSSREVHDVARNVPDRVLEKIGFGEGQRDAVVMVNFAPEFVAKEGKANVKAVADHVERIAKIAGKKHVGIGSDYDGIVSTPKGLEDVSKYPALVAELYKRGWTRLELAGFTGANFLRILAGAEQTARVMALEGAQPVYDLYDKRTDLPVHSEL
ncbi:hypothetical protein DENSPDRAFT_843909 [Dentipellis sp. KUC8613]|nr:hypothetical protein DENSPDRAFT_843909 [Dentipellis sp. KUC8613]